MARTARPLDTAREDELLVTAARHFAAAGYAGTSLNTVIAESGWGKSSFYHYFADKRALHDHVVQTLAARLVVDLEVADIEALPGRQFWPAMVAVVEGLGRAARRRPETWFLGEMFHRPASADDGQLEQLRKRVERWLRRAIGHGRAIGAIRDDLPEELLIELTLSVLRTLDRWALRHKTHSPGGGAGTAEASVRLVRDLIERR